MENAALILTEADLQNCVAIDADVISVIEQAFIALQQGRAQVPPIVGIEIPEVGGEVCIKTAYIAGLDSFVVKAASGFYNNASIGLPTASGLMLLLSTRTGVPIAVLFDNGYLTQLRTAAAGAIAAKYMAPQEVGTVGVLGSGIQARFQVHALACVRKFNRLVVYSQNPASSQRYAGEMSQALAMPVEVADSVEALVRQSDLLVTTTPSREPLVRAEWLHEGMHITAIGSDGEEKQELDATVFRRATVIACDLLAQCRVRGELHHAYAAGLLDESDRIIELGELLTGQVIGRSAKTDITVCDLTGVGVQDTAIGNFAYQRAIADGLGLKVAL